MTSATQACACACAGAQGESAADMMAWLDDVLEEYSRKDGALIPVLQQAQAIFGYLPQEVLKRVSLGLYIPFSEVAGVVSFYSFFSIAPRGKNVVRVCLGTACYVRGAKQVLEAMKKELGIDVGETTDDMEFSLEVGRCFGACGLAPTVMINDDVHQRVKPAKIAAVLSPYREAALAAQGD